MRAKGVTTMYPKERILIILSLVLVLSVACTGLGISYAGGIRGTELAAVSFLITLGTVILLVQLGPAVILLSSYASIVISLVRKVEIPIRVA